MTSRERAAEFMDPYSDGGLLRESLIAACQQAIEAAVAEEREMIIKITDKQSRCNIEASDAIEAIAAAIRKRGKP